MNIKKLLIGGITGGILFFLLGWLTYGNLLANFMKNNPGTVMGVERTEIGFLYLVVGNLLAGLLFTYIFLRANVHTVSDGLLTAAVVGFLMTASFDSVMYATTFIASKKMILADTIAYTVMSGIVGAAIAFVLSKFNGKS